MSSEHGVPRPLGLAGVQAVRLSAEHAQLELAQPDNARKVGDKVELIVGTPTPPSSSTRRCTASATTGSR